MALDLTSRATFPVWTADTVRYSDLDPNAHVNNGAINAFFEDGRVRFRQSRLGDPAVYVLSGFVLVRFAVEYHAPLKFPADVDIGTVVTRIGNTSYTLGQGLFHAERTIATAEVVTVRVDTKTGKPVALGSELEACLRSAVEPGTQA